MSIIGQVPGGDTALSAAASHSWEAAFLVVIILAILGSFGYVLKRVLDDAKLREIRLADRVTHLENELQNRLFAVIDRNVAIMQQVIDSRDRMIACLDRFGSVISQAPCGEALGKLQDRVDELVKD